MSATIFSRISCSMTGLGARIQPTRSPAQKILLIDPIVMTSASGSWAAIGAGTGRSDIRRSRSARSSTTGMRYRADSSATARLRASGSTDPVGFWNTGTR